MASVVEILRWESSVIWGLWGNWFAEIEAGSLIRGDGPQSRVSLPTLSAAVLRSSVSSRPVHCSGQYWAYLRTFYRAPGHWQGVMPGYVTIGLLADGMLMLPQTAPSAHRQDHTGATGTFSHNFTLGCLWSSELWLIMSCNKLPRHRQGSSVPRLSRSFALSGQWTPPLIWLLMI